MLLWTLIFFHILYQDKSQRMKNRMRLYGVTQLQQILAKSVVTLFITGILSVGSFMILQKILAFDLIGEDYRRIFSVDRKSTRLNSSHVAISYAVFCLKKKKTKTHMYIRT